MNTATTDFTRSPSIAQIQKMDEELGNYIPTDDEPFMNERQLQFFRVKLEKWKADIISDSNNTISHLQNDSISLPDSIDRASSETEKGIELRTRDRQRKLIAKIDEAIKRITDGEYGYCEETGEPISLGRLIARPIATLSLEAQERHEKSERIHRDD
jgi:DnaK suppressor protein